MTFPVLERVPVALPPLPVLGDELWDALIELTALRPGEWTLVGGQMVHLHALEHAATPPRLSTDLDIVVNARVVSGAVAHFVAAIEERGFTHDGMSPEGLVHRYRRGEVSIDVLAPDGLGARADLTTTRPGRTLEVPGGTQALLRTELLPVSTQSNSGLVPRPSLLGAIVLKALAVGVDDAPNAQRLDLAFLLSLVEDPIALADQVEAKDRQRLLERNELLDANHLTWRELPRDAGDRARAALAILTR